MVYLISNTIHDEKRLGLRFILSKQYAYWAYFWHQVDTRLVLKTRLVWETQVLLEQVTWTSQACTEDLASI